MDITILCQVVDNFGDIGFVYRLCRSLNQLAPENSLRLVTDNLKSFSLLEPRVKVDLDIQEIDGNLILDWNKNEACRKEFLRKDPEIVLQCFQCQRPQWLEEILFSPERKKNVRVVNLEYLTAEDWAEEFHLLKSGTRSAFVKKVNFLPGFTNKTGGMVLDRPFINYVADREKAFAAVKKVLPREICISLEKDFCILLFSYPRDFSDLTKVLSVFAKENSNQKVCLLLAGGAGKESFLDSWEKSEKNFTLYELPYISQTDWDALLCLTKANFIRGEDSFSRACLCGLPFLWHAYEQEEEVHLVKTEAFLERTKAFFTEKSFSLYKDLSMKYNKRGQGEMSDCTELFLKFLKSLPELKESFSSFSQSLIKNGNLTEKLISYLKENSL